MTERCIVAMGGMRAASGVHPLVEYVLRLTGKERPQVAGLSTATGDRTEHIAAFYERFPADRCEPKHLGLFFRTVTDLRSFLLERDVIFVGGGNTANMLAVWRVHGVDAILREAWEAGIVLCGGSAGSICWFEGGTTDSFDLARLAPLHDGLGFLPGTHSPHYDGEPQRRPTYHRLVADGFPGGIAIDDDAAVRYRGTEIAEVVTARRGATAYRVALEADGVVEEALPARLLEGGG